MENYDRHYTEGLKDVASYWKVSRNVALAPEVIKLSIEAERIAKKYEGTGNVLDGLKPDDILAAALFSATYNARFDFDGRIEWDGAWLYQVFDDDGDVILDVGERKPYHEAN